MPASRLRPITDAFLWLQGSLLARRQLDGPTWLTGRRGRERALIRRLLATYPGLSNCPPAQLFDVTDLVFASLVTWRRTFTLAATFVLTTALLYSVGLLVLSRAELPFPRVATTFVPPIAGTIAVESLRRHYIRRDLDRAVAITFPSLFCPCGYSLLGLPPQSPCPECGRPPPPV